MAIEWQSQGYPSMFFANIAQEGRFMPDDYAAAAARHYHDAESLAANARYDNAGHLIGFAIECAIKKKLREIHKNPTMICEGHHPTVQAELRRTLSSRGMSGPWLSISQDKKLLQGWLVGDRYSADGAVSQAKYGEWLASAQKVLSVAGIKKK
ncbi:hypothetical protein [Methylobacterium tarhaniae]|uniref:hypothetical protein n=1 Tax=Methylobacterium tarhaniae TaxID=1187852 RepID=UPI0012ECC026|nr:hypothetical protein [Methylobacterium tarhaniae]